MTRSSSRIMEDARDAMAGNYMLYFIVLVITGLLTGLADRLFSFLAFPFSRSSFIVLTVIDLIISFLVMVVAKMLQAGQYFLSLNISRYNRTSVSDLFLAFRYDTPKALRLCAFLGLIETLCMAPWTICLSTMVYIGAFSFNAKTSPSAITVLLLFFGGLAGMIVLEVFIAFPFSQTLFLYIDHQELDHSECLAKSRALMTGQIMNYFRLHLSMAGYFALTILSLGLGLVWTLPYLNTVRARYYMELTGTYKPY